LKLMRKSPPITHSWRKGGNLGTRNEIPSLGKKDNKTEEEKKRSKGLCINSWTRLDTTKPRRGRLVLPFEKKRENSSYTDGGNFHPVQDSVHPAGII